MSVKRRDLVRYMEQNGFYLLREGANHAIYTDGNKIIPVNATGNSIESQQLNSASKPD